MAKDPYEIDVDEVSKIEKENKRTSVGLPCPKMNTCTDSVCKACDYIQQVIYPKKYPKGHPALVYASQKKAKANMYMNMVLSANPDKALVLKIGSKAGSAIIDGIKNKQWTDITNPLKNKGREMMITKTKGDSGFNEYSVSPSLKQADWEIPESVINDLANLDQQNLINMIMEEELTDDNFLDITSLKMGETLNFRMCPAWTTGEAGKKNKRPFTFIWRHWGVSQGHIDGTESLNWKESVDDSEESAPWDGDSPVVDAEEPEKKEPEKKEPEKKKKPGCFGKERFFDAEDEEQCGKCDFFKACGKAIAA